MADQVTLDFGSTIRKENCYEIVVDALENQILDGKIPYGSKIPSEPDLGKQFGVSRNVIREAMKTLKDRKLVDQRNGDGTYVTKPDYSNVSKVLNRIVRLEDISYENIYEMRLILEPYACNVATQTITRQQLAALEHVIKEMETAENNPEERANADLHFHQLFIEYANNPLMACVYYAIMELASPILIKDLRSGKEGHISGLNYHKKILDTVKSGDSIAAEAIMREHLEVSRMRCSKEK